MFLSFILIASLGAQSMHHEMNHDSHQDAKSIVTQAYACLLYTSDAADE